MSSITLTVFFEDPFWVGVVEWEGGELRAVRYVFGSALAPGELEQFVLHRVFVLLSRPLVAAETSAPARPANPKRATRAAARALAQRGASSKAHEALRLQTEQNKQERSARSKTARDAETARKRQIKVAKAKQRHRGH